ncbi:DUF3426 domain-containing protein [Ramlibacter humi]|uniref:DUF3426 domain-containing protein n=1 Tax=Ramlibacter humi TaxID=2530451 RepID=A0A4Z0BB71_9BURK|nr:DUF3426 domain-containing protein [Ramlibacter humi]TFY96352.1 DUF3426 domain-containing protein [Ramlibacter humi]
MSLITGCPNCGTMFRVVPDQLKISDGWVRCGHCQEVFDATAHLRPAEPVPAPTVLAADPPFVTPEAGLAPAAREEAAVPPTVPAEFSPPTVPQPLPPAPPPATNGHGHFGPSQVEVIEIESPYSEFPSSIAPPSVQPPDSDSSSGYPPYEFVRESGRMPLPSGLEEVDSEVPDSALHAEGGLEDVSFVRAARRKAFWRRPLVRALLVLLALVLAGLLAAQYAVHERDRLAATNPGLQPLLEQLCKPLGCRIGPPHRIDAILIDNSGFTRLRGDTYRLSFTLKNQAAQPVAMPALQLTLTDTSDQPVLQRVLLPRELGAPSETLAAAGEWSTSIAVAVNAAAGGGRIAGYKLLAFYP